MNYLSLKPLLMCGSKLDLGLEESLIESRKKGIPKIEYRIFTPHSYNRRQGFLRNDIENLV
ncbi:hypothetical protein AN619_09440 [Thermotalea metallivorans]|uniref:Uncharacterized protein n=1 Tax=Thermotalea metallivorans TaxID=520762 RepID=A0A140L788_9FIRM|nr:hypothetical protein AN619_09440 [Thermotalea metallivorans]